jgi:hypothetical protein
MSEFSGQKQSDKANQPSEFPVYDAFIAELDTLTINAHDAAAWVVGECTRAVRRAEMKVKAAAESGSQGGSDAAT